MRLFLGIIAIFIFSQFIIFPVLACVDGANATVLVQGVPMSDAACCQDATYKSLPANSALCSKPSNGAGDTSMNLINPLGGTMTVPKLVGNIINASLGIVGSLALLMFIYGGFTWMLAAGNEQAVEKGKNILTWATIGLLVIFASYSLVNFVIKAIIKGGE
jgi:hypothetical protein